ncbi:MAG: sensor histidine kinase KdpD [Pirellulaceae bacterium]|nr:sensor histidine kinase KdpD [Pirellulaceae bacterium]
MGCVDVTRPDPDQLLAQIRDDSPDRKRGQLRIFFGYAAGVGKTFAMLENAHRAIAAGRDLVLGYLEPHGRPATERLASSLETLPIREMDHRGVRLKEFDIDAALQRNPEIILVDELAHSNAAGSRHSKRWQDVQELREAGIDVWTTLNVQHIESLNDIVGEITGIVVRETIPDDVFESANEIELVDLPPDDLLERLGQGQIYLPEQAARAAQSFFKRANLSALREMSLRQAASRVHTEVEFARSRQSATVPWATTDRLLVCVGPSPTTARVIRTAKRMATALDAKWTAVSVDLPGHATSQSVKFQIEQHFRLAERLGAETLTLAGNTVSDTILDYARARNVTKILIGKSSEPKWKRLLFKSVVDRLINTSGGIDIYVIQGDSEQATHSRPSPNRTAIRWSGYGNALVTTIVSALLSYILLRLHVADTEANRVMIFLAGVAFVAFRSGQRPAIAASILAVLVFDYCFVPPFLTFAVSDTQYLVTFAVMLAIGLLISTLTSRLKAQIANARRREQRINLLYELGKELSSLYGEVFLAMAASRTLGEIIGAEIVVYLRHQGKLPYPVNGQQTLVATHEISLPAAQWSIEHSQVSGIGTNTLPSACALFVPLVGTQSCLGALAVRPLDSTNLQGPDVRRLLESAANQLALALERDRSVVDAAESRLRAESEQLRSTLLSSVSHDLKTPLASIAGASSTLLNSDTLDSTTRRSLLATIMSETERLNRVLQNILQMSRLDAGAANPNLQWHVLEEIVGSALKHTAQELTDRPMQVILDPSLPLVLIDDVMLEQVLINLIENAARYTPEGSPISLAAELQRNRLLIRVRDRGPGIPTGLEDKIFEKFHRAGVSADDGKGNGLGLAICRAITKLLGGSISVSNPPGGGAEFTIELPQPNDAPQVRIG